MGAKAKKAQAERRASMKRARKENQQKQYESWRDQGVNTLSRRAKANAKKGSKLIGSRRRDLNSSYGQSSPPYSMPKMNNSSDPRVRFVVLNHQGPKPDPQTFLNPDRELSQADNRRVLKYLGQPEGSTHIYGPRLARQMIVNTPFVEDEDRPLARIQLKILMTLKGLTEKEAKLFSPNEARKLLSSHV